MSRKKKPVSPSTYNHHIKDKLDSIILNSLSLEIENRYKNSSEFLNELINFTQTSNIKNGS